MLSRPMQWTLPTYVILSMLLLGCRGSYPLARSVQVTHDPSLEVPSIEGPPQRLATAKPRVGSELTGQMTTAGNPTSTNHSHVSTAGGEANSASQRVATMGHLDDSAAPMRSAVTTSTKTMQYAADSNAPATNRPLVREGNTQIESVRRSSSTIRSDAAQIDRAQLPPNASEMLEAFKNSPPEVQQLALRQLAAAATRTAESTIASVPGSHQEKGLSAVQTVSYESEAMEGVVASLNHIATPSNHSPNNLGRDSDTSVHIESISDRPVSQEPTGASLSLSHSSKDATAKPEESQVTSTLSTPTVTPTKIENSVTPPVDAKPAPTQVAASTQAASAEVVSAQVPAKADIKSMSETELYSELLGRLGKAAADESAAERSRRLVMLRHLMVLSGRIDDAVSGIDGMPEKEQEYLRHQLLGLWTIIDPEGHPVPGRRFSAALPQLREATNQLAAATDSLDVRSLAFCSEIEAYGQIKKFPSTRFKAGQQVILYCEIDNFVAAKIAEGYETNLQGSYDVFNEAGEKVFSQLLPADRQVSNNYLRDYFIAYQMFLPKDLSAGKYRLQLTIEDLTGKKYGQSMIAFDMTR